METIKNNKKNFKKLTLPRIIVLISLPLLLLGYITKLYETQPLIFNKTIEIVLFIKRNEYFNSIISLSLGIIGLVLTLISIFGVGVSKAVLTMEEHNINQYLNYVLDLIILSIVTAVFSLYLKHTLKLDYSNFSICFNLIYIIILISTIISLTMIIALTFMMYAINLLSYREEEDNKAIQEQQDELFISDTFKNILESINNLENKIDDTNKLLDNKKDVNKDN